MKSAKAFKTIFEMFAVRQIARRSDAFNQPEAINTIRPREGRAWEGTMRYMKAILVLVGFLFEIAIGTESRTPLPANQMHS